MECLHGDGPLTLGPACICACAECLDDTGCICEKCKCQSK